MLPQANLTFRSDTWLELATPRNACHKKGSGAIANDISETV